MIEIETIENGYLVNDAGEYYCKDIQELFEHLLLVLEGRSTWFGGDSYGTVFVAHKAGQKYTSPKEIDPA